MGLDRATFPGPAVLAFVKLVKLSLSQLDEVDVVDVGSFHIILAVSSAFIQRFMGRCAFWNQTEFLSCNTGPDPTADGWCLVPALLIVTTRSAPLVRPTSRTSLS